MKFVPNKLTRTIGRQILKTKKNSPHIFFVGGVVGAVGGTVLACRATLKIEDALDEISEDVAKVKTELSDRNVVDNEDITYVSNYHKEVMYAYGRGAYKVAKLYAPAVGVGAISIAALTGSHVTLTRRNTALTAALTSMSAAYEKYRSHVRELLGEEEERDIYHNAKREPVTLPDGSKEVITIAGTEYSPYARIFDEYTPHWQKDPMYNKMFVTAQQAYANQKLQSRGHLFLNDVYDLFGFERTTAGAVVGWVRSEVGGGDGYIDLGVYDAHNQDFVNGLERSIILDFNVDGVIYHLIEEV